MVEWVINCRDQGAVGIVGPSPSGTAVVVATFAAVFNYPMISYAATTPQLSQKDLYPTFLRTCPSDAFQGFP